MVSRKQTRPRLRVPRKKVMGNSSHKSYDVQQDGTTKEAPKAKKAPKQQTGPIEETGKVDGEVLRSVVDAPLRTNAGGVDDDNTQKAPN